MRTYTIIPAQTFSFEYRCHCCGKKTNFITSNKFRVNANHNLLDVWLIYKCEICDYTKNLTIYERILPKKINSLEYEGFMNNDLDLAFQYGVKKDIFNRNGLTVQTDVKYTITSENLEDDEKNFEIINPYGLKIKTIKVIADILEISKNKAVKMNKNGEILFDYDYLQLKNNIQIM